MDIIIVPIADDKVAVNNNLTWYVKKDYLGMLSYWLENQDFWDKAKLRPNNPWMGPY